MRLWIGKLSLYAMAWMVAFVVATRWMGERLEHLFLTAVLFLLVKCTVAIAQGTFRELWRHTSVEDLVALAECCLISTGALALIVSFKWYLHAPPQLALFDGVWSLALIAPMRVAPRIYADLIRPSLRGRKRSIVLAGRAERVDLELRRMQHAGAAERVVGLVLDGPQLDGARLKRVRVLSRGELTKMLAQRQVEEVTLVPPASAAFTARLEQLCGVHRLRCRSAASLLALTELNRAPEQLLDRPPAALDDASVREMLSGRRVLVTGAGGSIGSELSRQLMKLQPSTLVLADRGENALFHVERSLASMGLTGTRVVGQVIDLRDVAAVQRLFARHRPELVFHAAAHKHVPLMERHPAEAVLNNVGGTLTVLEAAHGSGVNGFVFVSTDKAVRPSSVMGATKRIGELCVQALAQKSQTRFMTVRFGNVLGSNGSVLPIFIEQIQQGGPVTVTHPEMTRFFMSTAEACQLVLRAAAQGRGGELFVLDMGEPMRIVDLAARVIERAGLRPGEDVPIVFSGPRPGEKLTEELMLGEESRAAVVTDGVWSVEAGASMFDPFGARLDELLATARAGDDQGVRGLLAELVPDYCPEAARIDSDDARIEDDEPSNVIPMVAAE